MRLDATLHSDCFDGCVREVPCRGIAFMHVMSMETTLGEAFTSQCQVEIWQCVT